MILLLFLVQAAAQAAPDLELGVRIRARSVTIEKQGEAKLEVTTSPDGGNVVDVRAPKASGRRELRNVEVNLRAEARIGDPAQALQNNAEQPETASPD